MIIHIVKENETIWSIARLYGVSPQRIITDNGLNGLPFLVVGQALIILIPDIVHIVSAGETVFSISREYNISEEELLQKNPTLINGILRAGDAIVIKYKGESNRSMYIYGYFYPYINRAELRRKLPYITSCAIFGYGFNYDGSLIEINDVPFINEINNYNAQPIILLTSIDENGTFNSEKSSELFNNIQLQNAVLDNMIDVMQDKGYVGMDIDFEYIGADDSEAFTDFVRNAANKMHEYGFTVNVDLAPKTSDTQKGSLYEGHDYVKLGELADTVFVMTYEWGYTYGPPMAVSPLPNVRRVIEYAVTKIDRNKIIMGVPNYGYDWRLPYERGVSKARSIGNEEALRIAAENGAEIKFDQTVQSPYFEYISANRNNHIVWFEDVRSIQKKYDLITEFGLKGGGYWNLMRPFAQNWSFLSYYFNVIKTE
ncbi:MAG: LysM peptidoglycan-binding domain-containing protein [Clostridia bacterium]|nr:LysM peptidoglycan-binding domain-containing protein [Clostridia bacterium]